MSLDPTADILPSAQGDTDRLESRVYKQLLDKIRFGGYALGQRLPSEHELSEEHGVSRPVVRAALAKLRDSGLIVSRRGAGSFVSSGVPTERSGYAPLSSIEDIAGYFRFRRVIEAHSVDAAAAMKPKDGAARLREIVEEMNTVLQGGEDAVGLDIRFHTTIAELSESRFVLETLDMLRPHWFFVGNFVRSLGKARERTGSRMSSEHLAIADAIEAGDRAAARQAMLFHIEESERRVFKGQIDGD